VRKKTTTSGMAGGHGVKGENRTEEGRSEKRKDGMTYVFLRKILSLNPI